MYPEDRVLVGVVNRERDLDNVRHEHWYRVPIDKAPHGIHSDYVAFFLSRAFGSLNGGIHYYARYMGVELVRRRDLLPQEAAHPRADREYYKLQLGELRRKNPPITNPTKRAISFIYTTWDRFEAARTIADLYSDADHFVDRVFYALERSGIRAERGCSSENGGPELRVRRDGGTVIAAAVPCAEQVIQLAVDDPSPRAVQHSVDAIMDAIRHYDGPLIVKFRLDE